ncbi:hypothetical protein ACIQ2D_15100 [Lysinibacillus sp. NPDC097287]|uniref:hypothetical protein n=1 Tax=Lysinibacillus sp. NPDC097287 TaxID=3364144 RepID=UPI003819CD00
MFKKKILMGHEEDTLLAIIEHMEKSNVPFEIGIKGTLKRPNDDLYDAFYWVKARKKHAEQVEAIVAQYVSQEDLKQWYKVAKKQSRQLEKKERIRNSLVYFLYAIAIVAIEMGKSVGADIVAYMGCVMLLIGGALVTLKYAKKMKKETGDLKTTNRSIMFFGIGIIVYAVTSIATLLRF